MPVDEEAIFHAARALPVGDAQKSFLLEACGGDVKALQRLAALLEIYRGSAGTCDTLVGDLQDTDTTDLRREFPQIESYEILEQIGEGGFSYVFRAQQTRPLRRQVAIKLLKPGMDSREVLARFEAERQALAAMNHPGIARVFDAGTTTDGRPYFVMELVDGRPITDYCDQAKLSLKQRLELFAAVCQAVQHAHQRGIIHRDLKPGNVLVAQHDGQPAAKVIDFGIAKAVSQPLGEQSIHTRAMQLIGTPLYMSPEQAEAGALDIDTRSDVYSLGVLLYELLTGATPFDKEKLRAAGDFGMRRIIREDEPPSPSQKVSSLSGERVSSAAQHRGLDQRRLSQTLKGELDWIVMKALEKDRDRRYESASALAADVERYLNHEPLEASPPSSWYRVRKYVLRNRALLGTTTVTVLALLTGTGVSVWQAYEANQARTRALESDKTARQAVKELLADIADNELVTAPGMRDVYLSLVKKSAQFYDRLITLNPQDASLYSERAKAYDRLGQLDLVVQDYAKAVEIDPDQSGFHQELARTLMRRMHEHRGASNDGPRAMHHLNRAVELSPSELGPRLLRATAYHRLSCNVEARQELINAKELARDTASDAFELGWAFWEIDEKKIAAPFLKRAVELEPTNPRYQVMWGATLKSLNRMDESLEAYCESIRLNARVNDSTQQEARCGRGEVYLALGRYEEALLDVNKVIELDGKIHAALCVRAQYFLSQRMWKEALADISAAIDLSPGSWWYYKRRAAARWGLRDYHLALDDLDMAMQLNPGDISTPTWIPLSQIAACPDQSIPQAMLDLMTKWKWAEHIREKARQENESEPALFDLERLATFYEVSHEFAQLESVAHDLLDAWSKKTVPHQIAVSRSLIGASLLGQGKIEEAEPLLLAGFDEINTTRMPGYAVGPDLSDAAKRLVRLYEAKDDLEQVVRWQYESEQALTILPKPAATP